MTPETLIGIAQIGDVRPYEGVKVLSVATEEKNGYSVAYVQLEDSEFGLSEEYWFSVHYGFPVEIRSETQSGKSGYSLVTNGFTLLEQLDENLFELPG